MDNPYSPTNVSVINPSSTSSSAAQGGNGGGERRAQAAASSNSTTTSIPSDRDYHANAHTQAIVYIVIILVLYFSALTIIIVRYMRKERNQFHLPRYLLKKDRSPPSPTASSSFRLNSGRRAANNMNDSITADFTEVTQCLNTVSNQLMMEKDANSAPLVPNLNNQIDTTSV